MSNPQIAQFMTAGSIAAASITASYAAFGSQLPYAIRIITFTNTTDADMWVSTDGTNNMIIIPASSFKLFDLTTNRYDRDQFFVLPSHTQFFIKYVTAPTKGAVYIEGVYGIFTQVVVGAS